eukprot:CAMPEP_0202907662 /NCGR_PEP_ID=MMETSP1392-20130828/43430_1 /ASSEMBLY_ACC=CAM_ASM_000868 /TAXON_ID=225041 /ORGANISM="Chlamydomonas chlamydogama, Strain SAG 11-48b" /LENGTH=71 /DNA_ID=CAMNT_0049596669 /DNA_START=122 /DNA_END=337 /DNA_ORIENTATION=+
MASLHKSSTHGHGLHPAPAPHDHASTLYLPLSSKPLMYLAASPGFRPPCCTATSSKALATSAGIFWADPET